MIIYHCLRNVSRAIQRGTQAQDHSPQPTAASDSMLHLHPSSALKKISKKLSGEVGTLLIYTSGGGGGAVALVGTQGTEKRAEQMKRIAIWAQNARIARK